MEKDSDATICSSLDYIEESVNKTSHQEEKRRQDSASFTSVTAALIELPGQEAGSADVCISSAPFETPDLNP